MERILELQTYNSDAEEEAIAAAAPSTCSRFGCGTCSSYSNSGCSGPIEIIAF